MKDHITSREHILSNQGNIFSKKASKTNIAFKDKDLDVMSDEVDMTLRLRKANKAMKNIYLKKPYQVISF